MTKIKAQVGVNFEDWYYGCELNVDNVNNPNNIWQIGKPNKKVFNSSYSEPNAIITDTLKSYPINDTSIFELSMWRWMGNHGHTTILHFKYKIDADSLYDYGKIEFSTNKTNWYDIFEADTIFDNYFWESEKPVLTGYTKEWMDFSLYLTCIDRELPNSDTVFYRFTFISDSIDTGRDGWIIDNIELEDWYESISETGSNDFNSFFYPNPAKFSGTVEFENQQGYEIRLEIINLSGQILKGLTTKTSKIEIDLKDLCTGLYHYRLINYDNKTKSFGKFLIE